MSRGLRQSSKKVVLIVHRQPPNHSRRQTKTNKDQNGISGLTSKEPVKVSPFVPATGKQRHRRPPVFFADYPKPSTRPPRHN
ncbi:Protein GOLVEN 10 [Cardamine amara subsp. amara]|uniref:Protein GOLVEN 10 n=1 Tax=Cardamine amara subsp. amara TaxID=228776 RepID=A0ABD1BYD0_CARAN